MFLEPVRVPALHRLFLVHACRPTGHEWKVEPNVNERAQWSHLQVVRECRRIGYEAWTGTRYVLDTFSDEFIEDAVVDGRELFANNKVRNLQRK